MSVSLKVIRYDKWVSASLANPSEPEKLRDEVGICCPKPKRIIDKKFLELVKNAGCVVCERSPCDPHHITSVGAGGGDTIDNVMGLCRIHHTEWHKAGRYTFIAKHRMARTWMETHNRRCEL